MNSHSGPEPTSLAKLGFRMPPEWHRHERTWLSWPHNEDTWPTNLAAAQNEFVRLVAAIAADEQVSVLVGEHSISDLQNAIQELDDEIHSKIQCVTIATNDAWIRDYGPTFVIHDAERKLAAIDWQYNAWGGKYPPFDDDQRVADQIFAMYPETIDATRQSEFCIEGGAVEIDEDGVLMCTHSSMLDPNRNPNRTIEEIERELKRQLGASQVIWLPGDTKNGPVLIGDDTDAHIDQLARFAPGGNIVYAWTENKNDTQYAVLEENLTQLKNRLKLANLEYQLTPLPLPDPVIFNGFQLPACYCNFYVTNRSVIVPVFDREQDSQAMEVLGSLFPNRQTVGLPSTNLTVGLGSFHCLTQQMPLAWSNGD